MATSCTRYLPVKSGTCQWHVIFVWHAASGFQPTATAQASQTYQILVGNGICQWNVTDILWVLHAKRTAATYEWPAVICCVELAYATKTRHKASAMSLSQCHTFCSVMWNDSEVITAGWKKGWTKAITSSSTCSCMAVHRTRPTNVWCHALPAEAHSE